MERDSIIGYYEVSRKEQVYYAIRLGISLAIYAIIGFIAYAYLSENIANVFGMLLLIPLIIFGLLLYIFKNGLFIGLVKSLSVKINEKQLPEIYEIVVKSSRSLNIQNIPNVYLFQAEGSLNAFAKKFFNSNYIVIYSDLLEAYYNNDKDAVEFVIAHELGHIKRHHFFKELFLAPSMLIPFLTLAYYRGCEYTCDNVGKALNAKGAINGLLMLASGKSIYKEINLLEYMKQKETDSCFWRWLAEKFLSHPSLYKRLINVYDPREITPNTKPKPEEKADIRPEANINQNRNIDDHSRYMPS